MTDKEALLVIANSINDFFNSLEYRPVCEAGSTQAGLFEVVDEAWEAFCQSDTAQKVDWDKVGSKGVIQIKSKT